MRSKVHPILYTFTRCASDAHHDPSHFSCGDDNKRRFSIFTFFSIQLDRVYDSESRDLCSKVNDRFEVKENNVSRRWTDVGLQNFNGSFFFVESSKNNGKRISKTKTIKYGTISGTHTSANRDGRQENFRSIIIYSETCFLVFCQD